MYQPQAQNDMTDQTIWIASYKGLSLKQTRASSLTRDGIFDWMDRMNLNYTDFEVEEVSVV